MSAAHLPIILNMVSDEYRVPIPQIEGRDRNPRFVLPRQVFCLLARELTDLSITGIGRFMGGRDHTTVIKAIERIQQKMQADHYFREQVSGLHGRLEITFTPRFYRHTAFHFKHSERPSP